MASRSRPMGCSLPGSKARGHGSPFLGDIARASGRALAGQRPRELYFLLLIPSLMVALAAGSAPLEGRGLAANLILTGLTLILVLRVGARHRATVRLSETDALTGLLNRRCLKRDLERARRLGEGGAALVFADLDGFKSVNDRLGHAAGDEVLRRTAGFLSANTRAAADRCYRVGGDEFACLLTDTSARREALRSRAEALFARLREELAPYGVGASFGFALVGDRADAEALLLLADERMYLQKLSRRSASREGARV